MPSCFKVSANNFEEIYNLGLIQYVSPFERAKDIWALMDMLQLLEKLCDTSDKKIMDELYEWFGIGNDRRCLYRCLKRIYCVMKGLKKYLERKNVVSYRL